MRSSLSRYAFFVVLLLAWILPYAVVSHTYPIPTFYAEFAAFALYMAAAAALGCALIVERAGRIAASPKVSSVPLLLGLFLLLQIALVQTAQPTLNMLGAASLMAALVAMHTGFWTSRLNLTVVTLRVVAVALILGGLFAVFCQLAQTFGLEARFSPLVVAYRVAADRRPFGNMAQANHLATYISFAMAAAVYLVQSRRMPLTLWLPLALTFFVGEALTVSRTPWLQTIVIVAGAALMALAERRQRRVGLGAYARRSGWETWQPWAVPVLLVVLFFAVNHLVRWANGAYGLHLAESAADRFRDAGQISPRLSLWHYGWTMFVQHPLFGVGWGEFPRYQYLLVDKLGKVEIANNSHDIVIDLLAKTGVIGVAIILIGLVFWMIRAAKVPFTAPRLFCFTLLGVFVIHALVEYPQQYLFFLLPIAFLIGLLDTGSVWRLPRRATHIGFAVLVALGLVALLPALFDYRRTEVLYYGSQPEVQYRAAPARIFSAWGEYGLATLLPLNKDKLPEKLAMHRQAIALLPGETVLKRYAVLLELAGQRQQAIEQVAKLQIFSQALHDWPDQLASVYHMCDEQGPSFAGFKAALVARFGAAPKPGDDSDDDDDTD